MKNAENILLDYLDLRPANKVKYEKGKNYLIVYSVDQSGERMPTFYHFNIAVHFLNHKYDVCCDADDKGVYLIIRKIMP